MTTSDAGKRDTIVPRDVELEVEMLLRTASGMGPLLEGGLPPPVMCPECGESLWGIGKRGSVLLYRCHTGHVFDQSSRLAVRVTQNEQAMWATMKALEERSRTFLNMARDEGKIGRELSAAHFRAEAARLLEHAETLRSVLITSVLR